MSRQRNADSSLQLVLWSAAVLVCVVAGVGSRQVFDWHRCAVIARVRCKLPPHASVRLHRQLALNQTQILAVRFIAFVMLKIEGSAIARFFNVKAVLARARQRCLCDVGDWWAMLVDCGRTTVSCSCCCQCCRTDDAADQVELNYKQLQDNHFLLESSATDVSD